MQQRFDTTASVTTILDLAAGHVRLIAADRADTTVEIRPADPAESRDTKAAERIEVTCADNVLRIQDPEARDRTFGHPGSVEVTVHLPAGSDVQATAAALGLHSEGRLGEVTFDSAQGPVRLGETAAARITLQDGDITLAGPSGPGRLTTARGDIRVEQAGGTGALELRTRSGDITVTAVPGVSASLDAGTSYGRIDNALKNDGTAALAITATTDHGDIAARSI
ncbi:hypothetical protein SUDANB121_03828 [Nocardiopsis dassonvillei]|uniref:DUF4097 family beta strand repeat-containing protein n=1 Tax=Nocardiopsis dassonvillei TaxID=2014 RepID=UPI003F54471A